MQSQPIRSRFQRDGASHTMSPQFIPLSSNGIPRLSHKLPEHVQPFTTPNAPSDNPSCAWSQTQQTEITRVAKGNKPYKIKSKLN